MAITVRLKDFSRVLGDLHEETIETQKRAVVSGVARSIPDLVRASPKDTGQYASSWDFSADEERALLGNYAPHAPIIEYGARPFTPPIEPLLAWAKRVLNDDSQPPNYSPRVWRLARGTQQKIARVGMQPRHVLTNMIPKILDNIRKEFLNG